MRTTPFHSIRWRVQTWHGLILLFVIAAFCLTAHRLAWNNQLRRIDTELEQTMGRVLFRALTRGQPGLPRDAQGETAPLSPADFLARLRAGEIVVPGEIAALFQGNDPGHLYFSFQDGASGRVLLQSENVPAGFVFPQVPLPASPAEDAPGEVVRGVDARRELIRLSRHGLGIMIGRDITPELEGLRRHAWSLAASGLAVWLLGLLGGWWVAGRAIRPVEKISATAARIAGGNLTERIDTDGTDSELDQLSRVLNSTFDRLHDAFERQRRFTADASHELRTPITILLSETQRALRRERSPAEYREVIQTCGDTALRMRRLVEALLLLARQENQSTVPDDAPVCDLAEIVREAARQNALLAAEHGISVQADLQTAPVRGDAAALAILATNLLSNAIAHHRSGGERRVWIVTRGDSGGAVLAVRDDGPGINAEDLPHLFERFYRADTARTGTSGHAGLGLSIVRIIAENHGGTVSVESTPGAGAVFTVRLPKG